MKIIHKILAIILFTFFIVISIAFVGYGNQLIDDNSIKLHDEDCHRPYNDDATCTHACDHSFCDCYKDCEAKCKLDKGKCVECTNSCWSESAKCYNKCCDDGKIDC